ncbi:uncharacterized protein LOC143260470 [Megalopta genalis]|uniref:uncharacterized protein LOC143260470 n=1 Tax=Megalopta genalis TaxID=115081 RepID=UPI003FD32C67
MLLWENIHYLIPAHVVWSKVRHWPVRYITRVLSFNGVVQITVISEASPRSAPNYGVGEIERPPWRNEGTEIFEDLPEIFFPRCRAPTVAVSAFDYIQSEDGITWDAKKTGISIKTHQDASAFYLSLSHTLTSESYFGIFVPGGPIVQPPSQTVTAKEGEPLSIVVEFCAEPRYTKVMWVSEENVYLPGAPPKDGIQALAVEDGGTESCYRTMLSFDTIQWSHAGEWLLLVRSSEGIADASVLLNVTRASEYSHAHFRSASLACLSLCLALAILQEHRR